jgi:hypothetical protein
MRSGWRTGFALVLALFALPAGAQSDFPRWEALIKASGAKAE